MGTAEKIGFGSVNTAPVGAKADVATQTQVREVYGNLPLYFIQNNEQLDKRVKFYEKGSGHTTFFTQEGVYLHLTRSSKSSLSAQTPRDADGTTSVDGEKGMPLKSSGQIARSALIKLTALGANKDPKIIPEGLQEGRVNYFIGNDPTKWRTNIPTYQAVVYKELYPGIDMKFYGDNRQLEYDIIVKPGADPAQLKLAYEGVEGLRVTKEGDLEVRVKEGMILQKKPVIYQEIEGKRVDVTGKFTVLDSKVFAYSFDVDAYNKNASLVIDPPLVYSTYLGGSGEEPVNIDVSDPSQGSLALNVAVNSSGNAYVLGSTYSTDFPTPGGFDTTPNGDLDAFVSKLNATGTGLLCSTYFGGSGFDDGHSLALDGSGNAYITGRTYSANLPTTSGAFDTSLSGSSDVYMAKLSGTCGLVYATYLGGTFFDWSHDIAVDGSGIAYITGGTGSSDFPVTSGAYDTTFNGGGTDAYVVKLNPAGTGASDLLYSSYLGGSGGEGGGGIAVDNSGRIYLIGGTTSTNFPTLGAYDPSYNGTGPNGDGDAFVAKLNPAGTGSSDLLYSTYLGGSSDERGVAISVNAAGIAFLSGRTWSSNFPTTSGAFDPSYNGSEEQFLAEINPSLSGSASLLYSTYLGGNGDDNGHEFAVDASGNIYTSGMTTSTNFPTTSDALQTSLNGPSDAYVVKLRPDGNGAADLKFSTYLGGSGDETGHGIAVDALGNIYVTGRTSSSLDFPVTPFAYDKTYNGGTFDVFVAKIGIACDLPRLLNISTRGFVGTGDNVLIGGYIIGGTSSKTVLIRARGPSMSGAPFFVPGTLSNPTMQLYSFALGTFIAQNDNWQATDTLCSTSGFTCGTPTQISATGLDPCIPNPGQTSAPPGCTQESAILITLPAGNYGAIVNGVSGGTGVGLVEVFELSL